MLAFFGEREREQSSDVEGFSTKIVSVISRYAFRVTGLKRASGGGSGPKTPRNRQEDKGSVTVTKIVWR